MFTTKSDMLDFNDSIIENLFELLRTVLKMCYELGEYTDEDGNYYDCRISEELEADVQIIFSFHSILIDSDTLKSIKRLIKDDGFITVSKQLRHLYHVSDGCDYFLEHLDRIADEKYVPTFTDIKYCRDRTIGVTHEEVSYEFHGKQIDIDIFDVGGQRAERKAWQNVFANTSALYFFVAISEYAMKCIEDDVTNRICEALSVLRILSEAPVFATTPMLIVVTKSDQLKAKLDEGEKFHLEPPESGIASFEPYRGDNTLEDIQQYIEDICRAQVKGDKKVIVVFKNLLDDNVTFRDEFDQLLDAVEALKA
ncbi:guanine nucleotide-binding protein subunit alpha [Bonamia ostreae]|uniref:Guanine nucleotide-binding protein subunit alpha n=1 Tax=Bonamia ostreae TaxID=126728 RepID=A0ABV2AN46_9EUKA